jgi:hypothetical protein
MLNIKLLNLGFKKGCATIKVKLLMLFVLACGTVMLIPGIVLAAGYGGGGGHGGGGQGGGHGGGGYSSGSHGGSGYRGGGHNGGGYSHGGHGGHDDGHHGGGWGHTSLGFSFGLGYYGSGPYYYPYYSPYYYNYYSPYYYPSYYPSYPYYYAPSVVYVDPPAAPPPPPPVEVQRPAVVQQNSNPEPVYGSDPYKLREKKAQFMGQLQHGDKSQRLQSIDELTGFSYDDQVRTAFENILQTDPDAAVRKAVAEAFGKVKNQKPLGVLEKARVFDSDLEVRQAADTAIRQIKS